jgi:hypothetical protein
MGTWDIAELDALVAEHHRQDEPLEARRAQLLEMVPQRGRKPVPIAKPAWLVSLEKGAARQIVIDERRARVARQQRRNRRIRRVIGRKPARGLKRLRWRVVYRLAGGR